MRNRKLTDLALKASYIFILSLALPAAAHAAVTINEVMYNPKGSDSGREWVELYNSGSSDVALVGGQGSGSWRIADSSNHTLTDPVGGVGRGSLVVPAGGYLIVASDPAAFIGEYGGSYSVVKASLSLTNTGTTISLIDGTGATVDSVTYAASQGGGDNGTSLQMASSSWLQALPTPGAANAAERYDPPAETAADSSSSKSNSTSNPGYVAAPLPQVFADAGGDRTVIVGADAKFVATAYDRDRDVINYAKFYWNFGDGTSAEGPWVMHHFSYPGTYAVELTITNTSLRTTSRITVAAEPASVVLAPLPQGGVAVQNKSGRDLDLSFWGIKQGEYEFALPEHSVVLAGAAINISAATLGFAATEAKLYYPDGTEVIAAASAPQEAPEPAVSAAGGSAQAAPIVLYDSPAVLEDSADAPAANAPAGAASSDISAAVAASDAALPLWTALAGLSGVMGLGVASVWARQRKPVTGGTEGEFTIE